MAIANLIPNIGQSDTWTPSLTGFASAPTILASRYTLLGKWCLVHFRMTATTSNATTFTLTLPFAAANTATQFCHVLITDNSAVQTDPGRLDTTANSNIATLQKTLTASVAFTGSGTKAANFNLLYEIA